MNLVEHVLDQDIPAPVLTPDIFYGRVEELFNPHPLSAPLILKMDGKIAGFKTFCNEPAEDDPGTTCLSSQNVLNSPTLCLIRPFVNVECLGPTSINHQFGGVIKDDNIEIIEGKFIELTLVDVDGPVPHTPLIITELSIRDVPMADDLTVTILKNKSLDPPLLIYFRSVRHDFYQPPFCTLSLGTSPP